MSSGLLQMFVELGNLHGTSNYVLYWTNACSQDWTWRLQVQSWPQASNNTGILNTCIRLWLTESEQVNPFVCPAMQYASYTILVHVPAELLQGLITNLVTINDSTGQSWHHNTTSTKERKRDMMRRRARKKRPGTPLCNWPNTNEKKKQGKKGKKRSK